MLRISIEERPRDTQIKLEGRVAGPWTAELSRVWVESAARFAGKGLVLDLRGVTYADASATQLLCEIYEQTHAELIAGTVWTRSLAEHIKRGESQAHSEEI
jgi:anti-anti-sigma regulatory factor